MKLVIDKQVGYLKNKPNYRTNIIDEILRAKGIWLNMITILKR